MLKVDHLLAYGPFAALTGQSLLLRAMLAQVSSAYLCCKQEVKGQKVSITGYKLPFNYMICVACMYLHDIVVWSDHKTASAESKCKLGQLPITHAAWTKEQTSMSFT